MTIFLLCIKIFFARLIDVSLGTLRTVNTVRGKNITASLIGFLEITIWFLVVNEALNTSNKSTWIVISYAMGFSMGTYLGGKLSDLMIKPNLSVQVILSKLDKNIIEKIRKQKYGVTVSEINGIKSKRYMLNIQIRGNSYNDLIKLITKLDPKAFISVNEIKYIQNGYFNIDK